MIELLLDHGADPNAALGSGDTALTIAIQRHSYRSDVHVLGALLEGGANVNAGGPGSAADGYVDCWTALLTAAHQGHLGAVNLFLDHGAATDTANDEGWTSLMWASLKGFVPVAEALLDAGADPNQTMPDDGYTALMWACQNGHNTIVQLLLARSANPNLQMLDDGLTALMWASNRGCGNE